MNNDMGAKSISIVEPEAPTAAKLLNIQLWVHPDVADGIIADQEKSRKVFDAAIKAVKATVKEMCASWNDANQA